MDWKVSAGLFPCQSEAVFVQCTDCYTGLYISLLFWSRVVFVTQGVHFSAFLSSFTTVTNITFTQSSLNSKWITCFSAKLYSNNVVWLLLKLVISCIRTMLSEYYSVLSQVVFIQCYLIVSVTCQKLYSYSVIWLLQWLVTSCVRMVLPEYYSVLSQVVFVQCYLIATVTCHRLYSYSVIWLLQWFVTGCIHKVLSDCYSDLSQVVFSQCSTITCHNLCSYTVV